MWHVQPRGEEKRPNVASIVGSFCDERTDEWIALNGMEGRGGAPLYWRLGAINVIIERRFSLLDLKCGIIIWRGCNGRAAIELV